MVDDISISIIEIGKARYFNLYCFPVCYVRLNKQFYTEVSIGDYIVKDETGNIYTCKEDLFNMRGLMIHPRMIWVTYPTDIIPLTNYISIVCFITQLSLMSLLRNIKVCKSHRHYDGEECFGGGWFIVMAELTTGQISYHYKNRHWELFNIPELDTAWEWDGHTPYEADDRIESYLKSN